MSPLSCSKRSLSLARINPGVTNDGNPREKFERLEWRGLLFITNQENHVEDVHTEPWHQQPSRAAHTPNDLKNVLITKEHYQKELSVLTSRRLARTEYSKLVSMRVSMGGMVHGGIPG